MSNMIHSLMTQTLQSTPRVHVKYSRVDRYNTDSLPKNTLVTLHDDVAGVIYFGIARCNLVANDVCRKDVGRGLARQRADNAMKNLQDLDTRFYVSEDGVSGKVAAGYAQFMEAFFYSYDMPDFIMHAHRDPWQRERRALAPQAQPLAQPEAHTETAAPSQPTP